MYATEKQKPDAMFVQTGAPQKAGERLGDDLFNLDGKAKRRRRTLR
jgi:hypothetical protein